MPAALSSGSSCVIEELLERGILIGGPFVEDADRPILQQGAEQGQSPPLALREVERSRTSSPGPRRGPPGPVVRAQLGPLPASRFRADQAEEVAERDGRRRRRPRRAGDRPRDPRRRLTRPSSRTTPLAGRVETGDQLDQRRLAAAVAPGQDDESRRPERQVDGPEREALAIVARRDT